MIINDLEAAQENRNRIAAMRLTESKPSIRKVKTPLVKSIKEILK